MRALLVHPRYPDTFWSFRHALKFISRNATFPPLGLLTVAAMLPEDWVLTLKDLNVGPLSDDDIRNADIVLISAMGVQRTSAEKVIERCQAMGKPVVAGGSHFTSSPELYDHVEYLVLNEAELTLPQFLHDFSNGNARHLYQDRGWADIEATPLPRWDLISMKDYSSMNIQYSRGCPFDCDFCDITVLYGRAPRTKSPSQLEAELEILYQEGWRGPLFIVDDNFIGNKAKLKRDVLPRVTQWNTRRNHPFYLNTESSINLADDAKLMQDMVGAGFESVFIGIETPHEESLVACDKRQNSKRDLLASVGRIQQAGLEVQGGFILGFDQDPPSIFARMAEFIEESGIVTAMVGLLNAPKGTRLHARMKAEGRLLGDFSGNTDLTTNIIPRMDMQVLLDGYQELLQTIYTPRRYYARVRSFLKEFNPPKKIFHFNGGYLRALLLSMLRLGVIGRERMYYWRLFFWSLLRRPRLFSLAILFTIYGFHFRKISNAATLPISVRDLPS